MSGSLETEYIGLGELIRNRQWLEVPRYQRDYAWKAGHVLQFLEDISRSFHEGVKEYFMGLLVLMPKGSISSRTYVILDGQQRLATASMLFRAIAAELRTLPSSSEDPSSGDDSRVIREDFVAKHQLGEETRPHLVLNLANNSTYQDTVVMVADDDYEPKKLRERANELGRYDSNRLLLGAAAEVINGLRRLKEDWGPATAGKQLVALAMYLQENVKVVCLEVQSPDEASRIFESLNDRGNELSQLDLIKNHFYDVAREAILPRWSTLFAQLGNDEDPNKFIAKYWVSRHGRTAARNVFSEVRAATGTRARVQSLLTDLEDAAVHYLALQQPADPFWSAYPPSIRKNLEALSIVGAEHTTPILLSAL